MKEAFLKIKIKREMHTLYFQVLEQIYLEKLFWPPNAMSNIYVNNKFGVIINSGSYPEFYNEDIASEGERNETFISLFVRGDMPDENNRGFSYMFHNESQAISVQQRLIGAITDYNNERGKLDD